MKEGEIGYFGADSQSILSELKRKNRLLQLKRRWLMGVQMSKSELKRLFNAKCLPESLLREDDVFYDDVKTHVEAAFGGHHVSEEIEITSQLLNMNNMKGILLSCLDSLTSKGLYLLAMFLTKGFPESEKTCKKLKKVIKKSISGFLRDQKSNHDAVETLTKLSQLLSDRENVRSGCCSELFRQHAAAFKILGHLKDLPTEALFAMRRKLRGIPAELPHLQKKKYGWSRDTLIHQIRKTSKKLLSELGGNGRNSLQEPLAKSLAVAGLSLKLKRYPGYCITDFMKVSSEIELLQNEIIKAIWFLETKKVRMSELQSLQVLLDPSADISKRSLRTSMKKLLKEYLFECNDLDSIPQDLLNALAIINRSSRVSPDRYCVNQVIDEEVECILRVSSEIKQLVWDLTPDHGFDENFADAYMEEPYESEDDESGDVSSRQLEISGSPSLRVGLMYSESDEESIAENMPLDSEPYMTTTEGCSSPQIQEADEISGISLSTLVLEESVMKMEPDLDDAGSPRNLLDCPSVDLCIGREETVPDNQMLCNNFYLDLQEASDETSMVAYNLIGYLLEGFSREEGLDLERNDDSYLRGDCASQRDPEGGPVSPKEQVAGSVIVQVVEEQFPSFPKSGLAKLKELVGA